MINKYCYITAVFLISVSAFFYSCSRKTPLEDSNNVESYTFYSYRQMVSPSFYFDALAFYNNGEGRADIYLKVGYDRLVFLKEAGGNLARYNCRIRIINEASDSVVVDNEFEKKIELNNVTEKELQYFDFTIKSYNLPQGIFIVSVKISDLNSSKSFSKLERVEINYSYLSSIQNSDMLLIHRVMNNQNGQTKITPIISKHIPFMRDTISSFFEVYSKMKQTVHLDMQVAELLLPNENESDFIYAYRNQHQYYSQPWQLSNYKPVFSKSYDLDLVPSVNRVILPIPINCKAGNYILVYKIKSISGKDSIVKHIRFTVLPEGFPKILSIDDKIRVSKLAIRQGEKNFFGDSLSLEEKYEKYNEFWSSTSIWSRNEFIHRAEIANERFTTLIEGWRTPMGRIYIICGEPDSYDSDRWFYQSSVGFEFNVVREAGKYQVQPPMVMLSAYTSNAYNYYSRMIDKIRTY